MTVYLVGAGPGDPGLLTRRGAELLGRADVVIHDRLSAAELLDLAPPHAERIDVGKSPGHHRLSQDEINTLLVERGRTGETVVRLKGGDPFVFARGSEEAHRLASAGVDYEVVPGITSALAVPAYGGIPVTQRFSSTSFTVVTGHEDPASGEGSVNWEAITQTGGTIVILMGVARWPAIARRLVAAGLDPQTPAAALRWGTRPEQQVTRATVSTLEHQNLRSPSVIVVGSVAAEDLNWFTKRPLHGKTVVVTRARPQASALAAQLLELGARVIEAPAFEVVDPSDGAAALRSAVRELASFHWVAFTSANGVDRSFAQLHDARDLGGIKVAAVGPATAAALERHGVVADLVPTQFLAEGLVADFPDPPADGGRVLVAVAEGARPVLADGLRAKGWEVTVAAPYRSAPVPLDEATKARVAEADAVLFSASGTVRNLVGAVGAHAIPATVISIGPITSSAARSAGLEVTAEANPHTIDGLIEALMAAV